jgi:hypothetical protein
MSEALYLEQLQFRPCPGHVPKVPGNPFPNQGQLFLRARLVVEPRTTDERAAVAASSDHHHHTNPRAAIVLIV